MKKQGRKIGTYSHGSGTEPSRVRWTITELELARPLGVFLSGGSVLHESTASRPGR